MNRLGTLRGGGLRLLEVVTAQLMAQDLLGGSELDRRSTAEAARQETREEEPAGGGAEGSAWEENCQGGPLEPA